MRSATLNLTSTRSFWLVLGLALAASSGWIILRAPSPINLALFPGIAFGLAVVLVPWLGPMLLAVSVPVQQFGSISMGGVGLTATKVAIAASLAALLIQLVSRRETLRGSILLVPYFAWFGAMILSLHGAVDMRAGLAELYRWSVTLFALAVALYGIRTGRSVLFTSIAMGFGVIFEGLLGVVQSIKDIGPSSFAVTNSVSRAYGTFGKPNTFAAYFELTGPLMAALAVWSLLRAYRSLTRYRVERRSGMAQFRACPPRAPLVSGFDALVQSIVCDQCCRDCRQLFAGSVARYGRGRCGHARHQRPARSPGSWSADHHRRPWRSGRRSFVRALSAQRSISAIRESGSLFRLSGRVGN